MKITCLLIALLVSARMTQGQVAGTAALPAPTPYAVVTNTANSRTWERTVYEPGPNGTIVPVKRGYIELASGLYFQSSGQWMASRELIESFPQGAIARQGQYQVIFANNLNSAGAIDMQTPDGKRLRSSILGLAYYDSATGSNVLFAQIQDSQGELISSNQVLYPNAFDGATADVRYSYKKGSFEQDVILRTQPPAPESLGLNSQSTEIEVLTEFINPPPASVVAHPMKNSSLPDEEIGWGAMRIGRGRAFDLGEPQKGRSRVAVRRQYVTAQGRNILVEGVPIQKIQSYLANLPLQANSGNRLPVLASKTPVLPKTPLAETEQKPMKLASASPASGGLVLDYLELNSDTNDFTFQTGTTYFISGEANLFIYGTTTIKGGTVIKFPEDASGQLNCGAVMCATTNDNPAVFTSENDDSVGQVITNSSGAPAEGETGYIDFGSGEIDHCRFFYAGTAVSSWGSTIIFNDCQIMNGYFGIVANNVTLYNSLVAGTYYAMDVNSATCENCTFDSYAGVCDWNGYFVNCIFSGIGSIGFSWMDPPPDPPVYSFDGSNNGFTDGTLAFGDNSQVDGSPFVSAASANYYLAVGSPFHGNATTSIDSGLLAELQTLTTYEPHDCSTPDTGPSDLGYHYPISSTLIYTSYSPSPAQICENSSLPITLSATNEVFTIFTYSAANPSHGTLSGSGTNLTYTPYANFTGTDSFTYTVSAGCGYSQTSVTNTVVITVGDANLQPNPQSAMTGTNQPVNFTLTATSPRGCTDSFTFTNVTNPAHGTLSGTGASRTYTPASHYEGMDSFTFAASDGAWNSPANGTVTIFVVAGPHLTAQFQINGSGILLNWTVDSAVQLMEQQAQNGLGTMDFKIYRSTTSGGPYTLLNTVSTNESADLDMNVTPGTTNYYVMTIEYHDAATGTTYQSPYSNEASAIAGSLAPPNSAGTDFWLAFFNLSYYYSSSDYDYPGANLSLYPIFPK